MKKNKSLILSGPYILWMVIFTLIPLGVVAYYAFTDPNTGAFSMKNIMELQNYLPVLWQSVLYSLTATATEPTSRNDRSPHALSLCSATHQLERSPCSLQLQKPCAATKIQDSQNK